MSGFRATNLTSKEFDQARADGKRETYPPNAYTNLGTNTDTLAPNSQVTGTQAKNLEASMFLCLNLEDWR